MPVSTNILTKPSKDSEETIRDINQRILNRQRKAEMRRSGATPTPLKSTSLTKEFFEGVELV